MQSNNFDSMLKRVQLLVKHEKRIQLKRIESINNVNLFATEIDCFKRYEWKIPYVFKQEIEEASDVS